MCTPDLARRALGQGLRERNWTSEHFRPGSPPWRVQFYEDSGRLLQPSWPGFRALVTAPDGATAWVNLPEAGAETFTYVRAAQHFPTATP